MIENPQAHVLAILQIETVANAFCSHADIYSSFGFAMHMSYDDCVLKYKLIFWESHSGHGQAHAVNAGSKTAYRAVRLLLAGEAKGRATFAEDVQGLIGTKVLHALHSIFTAWSRAPCQALVVLNIAAQLVLIQLVLVLV